MKFGFKADKLLGAFRNLLNLFNPVVLNPGYTIEQTGEIHKTQAQAVLHTNWSESLEISLDTLF